MSHDSTNQSRPDAAPSNQKGRAWCGYETHVPTRGRLVLSNVSRHFGKSRALVLDNISLTCQPGEFVVVVGPSGSGKSILLNIASGMDQPSSGTVSLDGKTFDTPGPDRAMVFQDHGLFPWLTAEQNVGFGLKMLKLSRSEQSDRVEAALKMVHLTHSRSKLLHELSGGMKQRIAIARALVMDPSVLFMDEPFASLDAQTRTLLHEQLQEIWCQSKKTILFVTHSVGEAVRLADRIIVIHAHPGRIRRIVPVELPHPRDFDSKDISALVNLVRREIEDEVNRINRRAADEYWKPDDAKELKSDVGGHGDGI